MSRDAGDSTAPVRASPAPVQPQKPKTVSGGWARPAGRRAQRGQRSGTHIKSPPIEARTEIPSALTTTTTTAPSYPPADLRGSAGKQQHGAGEHCPGREKRERVGGGRRIERFTCMVTCPLLRVDAQVPSLTIERIGGRKAGTLDAQQPAPAEPGPPHYGAFRYDRSRVLPPAAHYPSYVAVPLYIAPAPARAPTARIRSQKR